jgi:HD-GYP domain-containing protein (c-di-GMP phosphodiesterase class II)
VKNLLKSANKSDKLQRMLNELFIDPEKYLASHSVALAHTACGIASLMGWTSDSTFQKLTLAAFLHDITLKNNELAKIRCLPTLMMEHHRFTATEVKTFMTHPADSTALVREMSDVPAEVDTIILQHHELPDGSGFPHQLDAARITPLSGVFIIAHEFLNYWFAEGKKASIRQFINELDPSFQKGQFRNIVAALEKAAAAALNVA